MLFKYKWDQNNNLTELYFVTEHDLPDINDGTNIKLIFTSPNQFNGTNLTDYNYYGRLNIINNNLSYSIWTENVPKKQIFQTSDRIEQQIDYQYNGPAGTGHRNTQIPYSPFDTHY